MAKAFDKKLKKLPIKEQLTKIDIPIDEFLKKAFTTPVKNSKD